MRKIPRQPELMFLAAMLLAMPAAQALTVIPPTFEQLVSTAEVVVDGEVTGVRCELSEYQGRPLVYTYVSIRVLEGLKGAPRESVELRILGGTVGDLTMRVSGVPSFSIGERNLFFIEGNGANFCPLVAVTHGYYPIGNRESDGLAVVLRSNGEPLEKASDVSEGLGETQGAHAVLNLSRAMTVAEFKRQIRAEVAHAREQ